MNDAFVPSYRALNIDRAGVDDWTGWELHHRLTYRVPLRVMLAWDLVAPLLGIAQGAVVMRQRVNWVLEKARRGEAFSEFERVTVQRDRAFVVRLCMQAVNRLFDVSGGHALFLSEPLQRCHRDAQAVAHRARLMLETVGPAYGRVALSTPPA